ncbi:hypothetical protein ACP4OV_014006 [Aristida adscensionis]
MKRDPLVYGTLVRHHIILLDDESKVGKYITLFQRLHQIKKLDEKIYLKALKYIECGGVLGGRIGR